MTTLIDRINDKKYIPNVVVRFKNLYWAIRQPDSGLVADHVGLLDQIAINPTRVDPFQANTTINSYVFSLVDRQNVVSALFNGVTSFFQNEKVEIWIGRSNVAMDFSGYLKLPDTFVTAVSRDKNTYKFNSQEIKTRIDKPAFNKENVLAVNILSNTTIITAQQLFDTTTPTAGLLKIGPEFISYTGLDFINNRFLNCIRGEKNSIPQEHDEGEVIFFVNDVSGNPIDIILKLLVSSGGGSSYDVLPDGAGIDQTLINIPSFEEIRDEFFQGQNYLLSLYGVSSVLKFIEEQILFPNELRIITDNTSKIGLKILNRSIFNPNLPLIDEDTLTRQPSYSVDDGEVLNSVTVRYNFSEGTEQFLRSVTETDQTSISLFGAREPRIIEVKGILHQFNGEEIARSIAKRFLTRFSFPKPSIEFNTHLDKALVNLGDKAELISSQIPNDEGVLNFVETLEVLERGVNWRTGDIRFKLGFTSFTGIRECYLAPSDIITSFINSTTFTVGAGRGSLYQLGWKMRLYSEANREYVGSQILTIVSIVGDTIEVDTALDTAVPGGALIDENGDFILQENGSKILLQSLNFGAYRFCFADYDFVIENQKRYCFISDNGLKFYDGKKSYQIKLG